MPSPVGHGLGGIAAGWAVAPRHDRAAAWILAVIGAAADLDLLVGYHRGRSHSIGAAVIAGLVMWAVSRRWRWGLASGFGWGSHVLLDWLSDDRWPPLGIEALWPFSSAFYESPVPVFPPVSRELPLAHFIRVNSWALVFELAVMVPIVVVVLRLARGRRANGRDGSLV